MSAQHILFGTYCKSHEQQITECVAAAEKRAEEAEQARDETVATWAAAADDRDTYSSQRAELERKGLQLVNYLGPLMLAATGVVNGRMGSTDELRQMLDVRYDPTKGEALSLAAQLAAANAEIERLKALHPFAAAMAGELSANAHKGDFESWRPESLVHFASEIEHHVRKLLDAFGNDDAARVREYAADLGNYAYKAWQIGKDEANAKVRS